MKLQLNHRQYKTWTIAVIAALIFGLYFIRGYIGVILVSIILAFIFNPIHQRFLRHYKREGISASLTFLVSVAVILIPLTLILLISYFQLKHFITDLSTNPSFDAGTMGTSLLDTVNNFLAKIPGSPQITTAEVNDAVNNALASIAQGALNLISGTIGSLSKIITSVIIYIYLFVNILMHQDELIAGIKKLNPLGNKMSDIYLQKMGDMTKSMTVAQFIIAAMQGTESAIVLYLVGLHGLFSFFLIFLSFLSLIPLGAGIVTIPIGIVMILSGNVWQGVVVIANHLLIVTNIDNVMRPKLVPETARLNSALTILSVFAGVAMFGFFGIIVGPVIMVVLVTTLRTFLEIEQVSSKEDSTSENQT
jgi:predicted PurR-regulated permease PerM